MKLEQVPSGLPSLQKRDDLKLAVGSHTVHQKQNRPIALRDIVSTQEVENVVSKLNEFTDPLHTNLRFVFHEQLNEYYVAKVNPLTNEVIKEIPPKEMLDMYAAMAEFMGILIDEKV